MTNADYKEKYETMKRKAFEMMRWYNEECLKLSEKIKSKDFNDSAELEGARFMSSSYNEYFSALFNFIDKCDLVEEWLQYAYSRVIEAETNEDEMDNCNTEKYNCDTCFRNGDCIEQGIDGRPRWIENKEEN